jgi:hypothetical protein
MADVCSILTRGISTDGYGDEVETFSPGSAVICGFKATSKREVQEQGQIVMAEAELRLPIGTAVTSKDRVRLTYRLGTLLASPVDYEVIGHPYQGPSGLLLTLRRVTSE